MKKTILAILITSTSTFAYSEAIYLSCKVSSDGEESSFTVSLDKSTRKVTHTRENGSAFNAEGFFSPEKISYKSADSAGSDMMVTDTYTINRTDLSIINEFRIDVVHPEISMPPTITVKKGSCEIMKVKKGKI